LLFPELTAKAVTVSLKAGEASSDGGGVLLARLNRSYGYLQRFATSFRDHRDPELIEHQLLEVLRQRTYAMAPGYDDVNDHDQLRADPLLATLCGKRGPRRQNLRVRMVRI